MTTSPQPTPLDTTGGSGARRCWRCLETFQVATFAGERLDGWWLCQPCTAVLVPSKVGRPS